MLSTQSTPTETARQLAIQAPLWTPAGSSAGVLALPHLAEAGLEALALNVNKADNDKVLGDFPHGKYGSEVFLLFSVGTTTTQIYDIHSGLFVGGFSGGSKEWSKAVADEAYRLIASRSTAMRGTPSERTPWKGKWRPTSIAVVGAPGYSVHGLEKWNDPAAVPTPITQWLGDLALSPDIAVAVLNRTKEAKIKQPNCDWGSAYASLPMAAIRAVWADAPERPEGALVLDLGGGYCRIYRGDGSKIKEWEDYRPKEKTNDLLFGPEGYRGSGALGALVFNIQDGVMRMLREHPELAGRGAGDEGMVWLCIVATGKLRDHRLAAA